MTFRFNPFTDKLDCIGPQGGGVVVETLTGNDDIATSPVGNNINLIGIDGIIVDNNGAGAMTVGFSGGSGVVNSVTGTANQILASPTTGNVILSLIGPYTPATYTAHSVLIGEGTSSIIGVGPTTTAGQILQSAGSSADPAFSTATYPSTATANEILYASSSNVIGQLATGNNGVLVTDGSGVPSISSTLPTAVTNNITTLGTITAGTWHGGVITGQYGGTGVANTGQTINLGSFAAGDVLTSDSSGNATWAPPATSGTVTSVSVVSANGFAGTVATATTTPAITISTTATGVLSGNGTSISGSAVTQYDVLVGGASNAISSVGPGTSGQILQSGGNAANPAYSTSTYPSTNAINTLLYASSANVMAALATANDGVLVTSNTGVPSWLANSGTAGWVLTANTGAPPSWQAASGGSGITTINGDSGSISGGTVSITAGNSLNYSGSTVQFVNSGTTSILEVTNSGLANTLFGSLCGNATVSGHNNDGYGASVLNALTSGGGNSVFGGLSCAYLTTASSNSSFGYSAFASSGFNGSSNTGLGHGVGLNYTGTESSNILIGYGVAGTASESNVLRIGLATGTSTGNINEAFICGITGVTTTVANRQLVTVNSSTNQVGTSAYTINVQIFTSAGTYTPTPGCLYAIMECVGNGGGGAGTASATASIQAVAGGGGGGGYSRKFASAATIGASQSVTFGTTGSGGASGNNNGTSGGDVAVGSICIGKGGAGGTGNSGSSSPAGGAGGVAGTGDFTVPGQKGGNGIGVGTASVFAQAFAGLGGASALGFGFGGGPTTTNPQTGVAGQNYGAGGGGGSSFNADGAAAGGAGSTGIVVITEYIIA